MGPGRHPRTHNTACRWVSWAEAETHPYPCISHPVEPTSFLHFRQGPQDGHTALSLSTVNSNTQSGDSVQGQGRAALSYPQAGPPRAHSGRRPLLDPQVCKDDEMHSVASQSLPTHREDVGITKLHALRAARVRDLRETSRPPKADGDMLTLILRIQ